MPTQCRELHHTERIGWLRAVILGANDGILSTSSLVLGVAAAHASHRSILVTGVAGLVAGAMSMATGEYVSVHSQADSEQAEAGLHCLPLRNKTRLLNVSNLCSPMSAPFLIGAHDHVPIQRSQQRLALSRRQEQNGTDCRASI